MNKQAAIKIIIECAKLYKENLLDKNLLIVYGVKEKTEYIEALFKDENFLHLTGVEKSTSIPPKRFFKLMVDSKFPIEELNFKSNGTTEMKLSILQNCMKIDTIARMLGDYDS